jgi:hypothetical protein
MSFRDGRAGRRNVYRDGAKVNAASARRAGAGSVNDAGVLQIGPHASPWHSGDNPSIGRLTGR